MKRIITTLCALFCLLIPVATASAAYNPFQDACSPATGTSGANTSIACSADGSNPVTGSNGVVRKISLLISFITGVAAVIIVIIGGFQYITSGGDPQKAASARNVIIGACIGLIIIVAAQSIILFVLVRVK